MEYKTAMETVNKKPIGDSICIFCSDYNKDYWMFYAYIEVDNYESDIEEINELIKKLNWRDGDTYVELIDFEGDCEDFYHYIYDSGSYGHWNILDTRYWEIFADKGDLFFKYFNKLNGGTELGDLESAEYIEFEDWYDVLQNYNPELYKCLDEQNGLSCFDIEHFYNCQGFHEIDGRIVSEVN